MRNKNGMRSHTVSHIIVAFKDGPNKVYSYPNHTYAVTQFHKYRRVLSMSRTREELENKVNVKQSWQYADKTFEL